MDPADAPGDDRDDGFAPHVVRVGATTTTVRVATTDDVDRVLDLYHRLSPEDLHRRFFSGFRPERSFVEHWIDRSTGGGVVLVAVEGEPDTGTVVGDAGYVPVGVDVAELAITIAPDRRGWLGPYLLDVLVEHARTHGVADLQAEVLTSNCGMLALLRARGCAFRPSEDFSVAEVVIGTTGSAPTWPADAPHPRVLVEGSAAAWAGSRAADAAGVSVLACPGPGRGRTHPCPLLHGDTCPLVEGADAVIVALPRSAATTSELLDAHAAIETDVPIALSPPLRELGGDLGGRRTFRVDASSSSTRALEELRAAVDAGRTDTPDEPAERGDQDDRDAT